MEALTESFISTVHLDNCTSGHLFMWHVAKSVWLGLSRILMPSSKESGIMNLLCVTPGAMCGLLLQIYSIFICLTFMLPFLLMPKTQSLNMENLKIQSLGNCHSNELQYSKRVRKEKQNIWVISVYWEYQVFRWLNHEIPENNRSQIRVGY